MNDYLERNKKLNKTLLRDEWLRTRRWTTTKIGGWRMDYKKENTTFFVSPMKNNPGKWHATAQIGGPSGERHCIGENFESAEAGMRFVDEFIMEGL